MHVISDENCRCFEAKIRSYHSKCRKDSKYFASPYSFASVM